MAEMPTLQERNPALALGAAHRRQAASKTAVLPFCEPSLVRFYKDEKRKGVPSGTPFLF
jgi:hypothetical protein